MKLYEGISFCCPTILPPLLYKRPTNKNIRVFIVRSIKMYCDSDIEVPRIYTRTYQPSFNQLQSIERCFIGFFSRLVVTSCLQVACMNTVHTFKNQLPRDEFRQVLLNYCANVYTLLDNFHRVYTYKCRDFEFQQMLRCNKTKQL